MYVCKFCSDFGAFVNIFKAVLGTGILAAPMAIRNAGYLPAIICTNIIGIFVVHSKFILVIQKTLLTLGWVYCFLCPEQSIFFWP